MLKNFKATSTKARPEDIQQPVGVSERIRNIVNGMAEQPEVQETPQENRGDVNRTLMDVAGSHGEFKTIPVIQLESTPDEWNKFTPVSDEKKILMADSIYRNGLQQPIVVREVGDHRYQILAGNTRTEIYHIIYDLTHDEAYESIPAMVYAAGASADAHARELLSDTNYIQRAELSKQDRSFAIHTKLEFMRRHRESNALAKVAEEFNIDRTTAFYWDKIFNLIPEFFDMYDADVIDMGAAARLGGFPQEIQRELLKEKDMLTSEIIKKIPAKTLPGKVVAKLHAILEQATQSSPEPLTGSWHINNTSSGYRITINGKQKADRKPVLLFLPEKKLKSFMKKYQKFILQQEE